MPELRKFSIEKLFAKELIEKMHPPEQKKSPPAIGRSNSVIGNLKWWPISVGGKAPQQAQFGSTIAVQKLRESKWFGPEESRIFCAVVECGFIVEVKEDQENDAWYGVVLFKVKKAELKPRPENIEIYTIRPNDKRFKTQKLTLTDLWNIDGCRVRINNFGDKEKTPHIEKDIKNQISFALKAKQCMWHNTQHFSYWCRYGDRQQDVRRRQMSECVRWGSVGMNAGLLLMNRQKANSTSK